MLRGLAVSSLAAVLVAAPAAWRFTRDPGVRVKLGGPPAASVLEDGSIELVVCRTESPPQAYRSARGVVFTKDPAARFPACESAVPMPGGGYRLYYTLGGGGVTGGAKILSASSTDGLHWKQDAGARIKAGGFGVPEAVLDGNVVRLYWVGPRDAVLSAHSSDGLTFVPDPGTRLPAHYVDEDVVQTSDGWLMAAVYPSFPGPGERRQRIFLAASADGLAWTLASKPIVDAKGLSAFDPSMVPAGKDRFRIYYGLGPKGFTGPASVVSGVVRR